MSLPTTHGIKFWAIAVISILLVGSATALKASKLFKFPKNENYVYLTKFSVGEGNNGQFNFRAGFSSPLEGDERMQSFTFFYSVITDDDWTKFLNAKSCSERLALSNIRSYVNFNGDGYWSQVKTHSFFNKHRTTVYYIVAIN